MKRGHPEADIQRAIVRRLRAILPSGAIVHHSPNEVGSGGPAARKRQGILRGMGVYKGWADLVVLSEGVVLFLEVKAPGSYATPDQNAFADTVRSQGYKWALVRSQDEAVAALDAAGIKHRETTA